MRYLADQVHFDSRHRSIYLPQPRGKRPELFELFDAPDPKLVAGQREVTTVPPQSLYLLNSPYVLEQARSAADRLLAEPLADDPARIDRAFQLALGRPATPSDLTAVRGFFERFTAAESESAAVQVQRGKGTKAIDLGDTPRRRAWVMFCQLLIASPEFRYIQ
jgi:hypothetical protein